MKNFLDYYYFFRLLLVKYQLLKSHSRVLLFHYLNNKIKIIISLSFLNCTLWGILKLVCFLVFLWVFFFVKSEWGSSNTRKSKSVVIC